MKSLDDTIAQTEQKKKGRKSKKTAQKELLNIYYDEVGIEREKDTKDFAQHYRKTDAENYKYLSPLEKQRFESKFTNPKNAHQERYMRLLQQKTKKIIVVSGPAGTGKTLFATECGIKQYLMGHYEKLIFTRPSVSVDEDLGYLPGTLEEKMAPWVRPIYDVLYQFINPKEVLQHMEDKMIEIAPLG